ncbi:hypothetical protein BCO37747_08019 [Burkholderia contaminans]|nr:MULTISPECIES: hypothetical protein [Burkholderia cepacia complex]MBK1956220.1 hypothetical protein [Burkholderia contaminans]VBB17322.1 hypothetical protein BSTAB16_7537 [Burkholderia stabilis]VWC60804.1 hypothetical protein BLA17378_02286 [Burkholderia aenigmatica]CAB3976067.1 hypothetical protein BCO9919_07423 [Burkholderia cenocepacia]VWD65360.1 hypothetical protein BCO37747_08019 [Burkholderia contaminans]
MILQQYEPQANVYGNTRTRGSIELQEERFSEISDADRATLIALGWQSNGHFVWKL